MRVFPIVIAFSLGILCVYIEFRNSKESDIFLTELIEQIPLYFLVILSFVYFFKGRKYYLRTKKISSYSAFLIYMGFIIFTLNHVVVRNRKDNSKTWFTASNYSINKEGVHLDFKENNHLKATKVEKFGVINYGGSYEKQGSILHLYLKTDFRLGSEAYIVRDSLKQDNNQLHFVNDTAIFQIWY